MIFSDALYRRVEVFPGPAGPVLESELGGSRVVSIAHTEGVSCAALADGEPTGVDIETVRPRRASFYRQTFDPSEREWVSATAAQAAIGEPWLFTLLWALKECCLKMGVLGIPSIWSFPRVIVTLAAPPDELAKAARSARVGRRRADFYSTVTYGSRETAVPVMLTASSRRVMVSTRLQEGGKTS